MIKKLIRKSVQLIFLMILIMAPMLSALEYYTSKSLGAYTITANPIELTVDEVNTLSNNDYLQMMDVQITYQGKPIEALPTVNTKLVKDQETNGYEYPVYFTYQGVTLVQYVKVKSNDPNWTPSYQVQTSWYVHDQEVRNQELKTYQLNDRYQIKDQLLSDFTFIGYKINDEPTMYTGLDELKITRNMHIKIYLEPYIQPLTHLSIDIYELQNLLKQDQIETIIQKQLGHSCHIDAQLVQTDQVGVYPVKVSCSSFDTQIIELHITELSHTIILGQDVEINIKQYQQNDIVMLMDIQAYQEGDYSKKRIALPFQVDTSKVKDEIGKYPVIIQSDHQTKTLNLQITGDTLKPQKIEPVYIRYDDFSKMIKSQTTTLELFNISKELSPTFINYEQDLNKIQFKDENQIQKSNAIVENNIVHNQSVVYLTYDFPYELIIAIVLITLITMVVFIIKWIHRTSN